MGNISQPVSGIPTVVNVLDFNAPTDGSSDSYTAIQNALNQCPSGGTVYLPTPIYRTSAPLIIPPNVTLQGTHGTRAPLSNGIAVQTAIKPLSSFSGVACITLLDKEQGGYSADNNGQRI